jgi:hypothetical protein
MGNCIFMSFGILISYKHPYLQAHYRKVIQKKNKAELMKNIYKKLTDNRLKKFKLTINRQFDPEMDFVIKTVKK